MPSLRLRLMRFLESGAPEPDNTDLESRPVILLAPNSHLGKLFASGVAARLPNAVAVVDDTSAETVICGLPRWTTFEFGARAPALGNALALNFSVSQFLAAMFRATVNTIDQLTDGYHIRLRQHFNYYYDSIIYASPLRGWESA